MNPRQLAVEAKEGVKWKNTLFFHFHYKFKTRFYP